MKTVQEITVDSVKNILKRGEEYIWNMLYNDKEDSPELFIESLKEIINNYDVMKGKTEREMGKPSSEKFLEMIKEAIDESGISVDNIKTFRVGVQTQNRFPDGITGHSFFTTNIPHKYHPEEHTEDIYVDGVYYALLDYFGTEFVWNEATNQADLMSILGDKVIEFFKTNNIQLYWEDKPLDLNDENPEEVDLFFAENWDS